MLTEVQTVRCPAVFDVPIEPAQHSGKSQKTIAVGVDNMFILAHALEERVHATPAAPIPTLVGEALSAAGEANVCVLNSLPTTSTLTLPAKTLLVLNTPTDDHNRPLP